jgi:hypothetical protein
MPRLRSAFLQALASRTIFRLYPIVNRWRVAFVTTAIVGPLDLLSEFARSGSLLPRTDQHDHQDDKITQVQIVLVLPTYYS